MGESVPAVMGDTLRCSCRACSDCCGAKRGDGSSTGSSVAMRSLAFGSAGGGAGGALLLLVTPPASPLSAWAACSLAMVASASRNLATIVAWRNATRLNCATPPQPRSSHHTNCRARARGGEQTVHHAPRTMDMVPLLAARWATHRWWALSAALSMAKNPACVFPHKTKQCIRSLVPWQAIQRVHKPPVWQAHTRAYQVLHQRIGSHVQQRAHNRDVALGGSHVQRRVTSLCRQHTDKRLSCPPRPCTVAGFRLTVRTRNVEASTSAPCATRARRASSFPRHAASCNGV